jgi:hypothetical protein
LTFANVPATVPPRTIRPGTGKPTTIITWPITHSRQTAKPRPRRRSSTCQIVIAERRRTMVKKSRRQHGYDADLLACFYPDIWPVFSSALTP